MRKFLSWLFVFVVLFTAHHYSFARDGIKVFNPVPCDTPVYRYAMYRWDPADYELFFFHKTADQVADVAQLKSTIDQWSISNECSTNLSLTTVDLTNQSAMSVLPPEIFDCFHAGGKDSGFVLTGPKRHCLFVDALSVEQLSSWMQSLSVDVCEKLADQSICVFVIAADENADPGLVGQTIEQLETKLANFKADWASEKVRLSNSSHSIGTLDLDSSFAIEKRSSKLGQFQWYVVDDSDSPWFRWSLETAREDSQTPGVWIYPVFGRGRALPPVTAEQLTDQWLKEQLEFLTSACACTVKEQNPGVDLLLQYDWDSAAKNMVDEFGREEGNESLAKDNDYFPEFLLAGESLPISSNEVANSSDNSTIKDASLKDRVAENRDLTQDQTDDNQQEDSTKGESSNQQADPDNDVNRDNAQKTEQDNTDPNQGAQGADSDGSNQGGARTVSSEKSTKVSPDRMLMMVLGAVAAVVFAVGGLLLIAKAK